MHLSHEGTPNSAADAQPRRAQRGDLLFLTMPRSTPLAHGDITIYKIPGAPIPIVHRVIETHNEYIRTTAAPRTPFPWRKLTRPPGPLPPPRPNNTDQWILTKGDNNPVDDVGLYRGMRYLKRSHLVGKVQACVPSHPLPSPRARSRC